MEIIFKATIFPDCHTETAATPHPRTGTPPGETVKATGTTARATGIPIPLAKNVGAPFMTPEHRNGATPPEQRKRNEDTTATPSHRKNVGAPFMTPEHPNGATTPEQRKRNKDTTAPHPATKKRRGAIYDARTPERRNTTGPHPRQSATVNADGRHKWRPHDMRNPQRRTLRTTIRHHERGRAS